MQTNGLLFFFLVGFSIVAKCERTRKLDIDLEEYDASLSEFIREVLENFRDQMKTGISEIGIPPMDPLRIPNIDENIDDGKADMVLRMRNLTIVHLSTFSVENLAADLEKGVLYFNVSVPRLIAHGFCYMNGKILKIFPISSNGDFYIEVEDVNIEGIGLLNITTGEDVSVHMNELKLSLKFGPLKVEFASLLGGGRWTQTLVKLFTGLGRNLFIHFHKEAMTELDKVLLVVINKELDKGSLAGLLDKIPLFSVRSAIRRAAVRKNAEKSYY